MEYSSAVRQRFERSAAVPATGASVPGVSGSAGDRSLNVWIRFTISVQNDTLTAVEYNVYGCPHLIAACDWAAEWLRGRASGALRALPVERMARTLAVPREKFGKLLRLEDALLACAEALEREHTGKGGE